MRMILVGAMVAVVAMTGPAFGGANAADGRSHECSGSVHYSNPSAQIIVERDHGAGAEFGLAVASSVTSLLYTPVRFVYGVVGAGLGGFAGWSTGGDMRTAKGIWRVTTEGHYFMRPDYFDGTERFRFNGAVPPAYGPRPVRVEAVEARAVTHESIETRTASPGTLDAAPADTAPAAPADEAL